MVLDILLLAIVAFAFYWGYQKGIIYSLFSLVAYFIGAIAALRFSYIAVFYLKQWTGLGSKALSIVAFFIVLILVIGLIRIVAWALEHVLKSFSLNFVNQLIGGLIHAAIGMYFACMLMWFADKWALISEGQKSTSHVYGSVANFAPAMIAATGSLVPAVKDSYSQYETLLKAEYEKANEDTTDR
jgi:uncharacterized membrane protein required for colicin V production